MSKREPPRKTSPPMHPASAAAQRRSRLDAALRANLKRRKAQSRGRGRDDGDERDTPSIFKTDNGGDGAQ